MLAVGNGENVEKLYSSDGKIAIGEIGQFGPFDDGIRIWSVIRIIRCLR